MYLDVSFVAPVPDGFRKTRKRRRFSYDRRGIDLLQLRLSGEVNVH